MKGTNLLEAIEYVDDDIIEMTSEINCAKKKLVWIRWVAVAACFVFAVASGWLIHKNILLEPGEIELTNPTIAVDENLPKLDVSFEISGMSFEGLMFYDISEIDDGNPWTADVNLETMPVYKNLAYTDVSCTPVYLSETEMESLAKDVAASLGTEISEIKPKTVDFTPQVGSVLEEGSVYGIIAETTLGEICLYGNGHVYVSLNQSADLSRKYSFTYSDTSDAEAERTISYLLKQYSQFAEIKKPVISTKGDYSFAGEQHRSYATFDGEGNITQQILNFNFSKITFVPDGNGELCGIGKEHILSTAEKLGDYPIITMKEAENLYREGNFITTVPEIYMPKDEIAKCELIYRTGNGEKTFMPYYRFYIELSGYKSTNQAKGLKCFGAYYVPAVKGEYFADSVSWNGEFN